MEIIGGLDVHRKQITFDYLEIHTGEVRHGQIRPTTREHLCGWLSRFETSERPSRWKRAYAFRSASAPKLRIRGKVLELLGECRID